MVQDSDSWHQSPSQLAYIAPANNLTYCNKSALTPSRLVTEKRLCLLDLHVFRVPVSLLIHSFNKQDNEDENCEAGRCHQKCKYLRTKVFFFFFSIRVKLPTLLCHKGTRYTVFSTIWLFHLRHSHIFTCNSVLLSNTVATLINFPLIEACFGGEVIAREKQEPRNKDNIIKKFLW